jgi:hypothetical protein
VQLRPEDNPLWLVHPRDGVRQFAGFEVDHFRGAIFFCVHEKALPGKVHGHEIEASFDVRQFHGLREAEQFSGMRVRGEKKGR